MTYDRLVPNKRGTCFFGRIRLCRISNLFGLFSLECNYDQYEVLNKCQLNAQKRRYNMSIYMYGNVNGTIGRMKESNNCVNST